MSGCIIPLVGRSCAGKTTLAEYLIREHNHVRVITTTTRPMRDGERDGVDYHFLSKREFEQRVKAGAFAEHALVCGNYYGVAAEDLTHAVDQGKRVIMVIDPQGAATINAWGAKNNVRVVTALVDAGEYTLVSKLVERYLSDRKNSTDQLKTQKHYESRYVSLMTIEREWERASEYHVRLSNNHTQMALVDMAKQLDDAIAQESHSVEFDLSSLKAPSLPQVQLLIKEFAALTQKAAMLADEFGAEYSM